MTDHLALEGKRVSMEKVNGIDELHIFKTCIYFVMSLLPLLHDLQFMCE